MRGIAHIWAMQKAMVNRTWERVKQVPCPVYSVSNFNRDSFQSLDGPINKGGRHVSLSMNDVGNVTITGAWHGKAQTTAFMQEKIGGQYLQCRRATSDLERNTSWYPVAGFCYNIRCDENIKCLLVRRLLLLLLLHPMYVKATAGPKLIRSCNFPFLNWHQEDKGRMRPPIELRLYWNVVAVDNNEIVSLRGETTERTCSFPKFIPLKSRAPLININFIISSSIGRKRAHLRWMATRTTFLGILLANERNFHNCPAIINLFC